MKRMVKMRLEQAILGLITRFSVACYGGLTLFSCFSISSAEISSVNQINGESIGIVNKVYQGRNFLWLGGEKGLFRSNGKELVNLDSWNEKFGFEIWDLVEDDSNRLWIASFEGGMHVLDLATNEFLTVDLETKLPNFNCWKIRIDINRDLVLGCGRRIFSVDKKELVAKDLLNDHASYGLRGIKTLAIDNESRIWFATIGGRLFSMDVSSDTDTELTEIELFNLNGAVLDLLVDSQGSLWIATREGVLKVSTSTLQETQFRYSESQPGYSDTSLFEDSSGQIWLAGDTLYQLNLTKGHIEPSNSLFPTWRDWNGGTINSLTEGKSGELLAAANLSGLLEIPSSQKAIRLLTNDAGNIVNRLSHTWLDSHRLIYSDGSELYSYDLNKSEAKLELSNLGNISGATKLSGSEMLVATKDNSLWTIDVSNKKYKQLKVDELGLPVTEESSIYAMAIGQSEEIYIGILGGALSGLFRGNLSAGFEPEISDVYVDEAIGSASGSLFFATRSKGVFEKTIDGELNTYLPGSIESDITTNCMKQARNGVIWLCTNGHGLGFLDTTSRTIKFIDRRFTNDSVTIRDLVEDKEGYLWLMTSNGLLRFDTQANESIALGKEDAIHDVDFEITASINLNNGNILVAGDRYNYIIDTSIMNQYLEKRRLLQTSVVATNLLVSKRGERVRHSDFERLNYSIFQQSPLTLAYEEYLFSLKFGANNYIERDNIGFEYRLNGLENSWIRTSPTEAIATYSTLPHGEYEFQVRAFDPKSVAEQSILSFPIKILPPFWLTWQAYLAYLSIVLLAVYLVHKHRTKKLVQINRTMAIKADERKYQLQISNDEVDIMIKQKEVFFENLSHELKTPLSLIKGPLEKLKGEKFSEQDTKLIETIDRNAIRLEGLVEQIFDLTKITKSVDQPRVLYIVKDTLDPLIESFVEVAGKKSITLKLEESVEVSFELIVDSYEKIVSNLVSNAIKYTQQNGRVSVRSYAEKGKYVLEVEDNGPGIPVSEHCNIFERLIRLNSDTNHDGAGLGLALTKELVSANGGQITVESEVGHGARFTVSFSLEEHAKSDDSEHVVKVKEHEENIEILAIPERKDKKKVLVIEDNNEMLCHIVKCISGSFDCVVAENGDVGLKKAFESVPDLIITDLMMPVKNGFEVVDEIRDNEITSHIPVMLLTAKGDEENRIRGWNKNVDDYMAKPFVVEELLARMQRLLSIREIIRQKVMEEASANSVPIEKYSFQSAKDKVFYERFVEVIKEGFTDEGFNRSKAAARMAISERQLNRKLRALIEYNFSEFLKKYRLEKAKEYLLSGRQITEVSFDVGYSSPSYFTKNFKAEFGLTPKAYVESNTGN